MSDMWRGDPDWQRGLAAVYRAQAVVPQRYQLHVDEGACARKLNGYDVHGRRCYVCHDHTTVNEAFDIDEFPLAVAVRHERHTAWRLQSGAWRVHVDRVERLDSCTPHVVNETYDVANEARLGL